MIFEYFHSHRHMYLFIPFPYCLASSFLKATGAHEQMQNTLFPVES